MCDELDDGKKVHGFLWISSSLELDISNLSFCNGSEGLLDHLSLRLAFRWGQYSMLCPFSLQPTHSFSCSSLFGCSSPVVGTPFELSFLSRFLIPLTRSLISSVSSEELQLAWSSSSSSSSSPLSYLLELGASLEVEIELDSFSWAFLLDVEDSCLSSIFFSFSSYFDVLAFWLKGEGSLTIFIDSSWAMIFLNTWVGFFLLMF